jgi:N-acyl homoserine lactone hydrolase
VTALRLYVIPAGRLRIDKGAVFTPGIDDGVHVEVPVPVYLIQTDTNENVLVDTGIHPANVDDPYHAWGKAAEGIVFPILTVEDRLESRLAEIGLGLADITHVVNTHLHPDHCGANLLFPHAEILVQRDQFDEALGHPEIDNDLFDRPELSYRFLDGDTELFAGVRAILAPGHARGLQALLVSLPNSGDILIAGDAIDTAEHIQRDLWTHCPEPDAARQSALHLQSIAAERNALLLLGHDPDQWQTLRLSPKFYD